MTGHDSTELEKLRRRYLRYRAALRDPITGLCAFSLYFDRIREMFTERHHIGLLWIGLGDRRLVESVYGWEAYDDHIAQTYRFLSDNARAGLPEGSLIAAPGIHADAFVAFLPADHAGREWDASGLSELAGTLRRQLEDHLDALPLLSGPLGGGIRIGAAVLVDNPFHRFERRVYQALDEARELAERPRESQRLAWMGEVQRLVRERDVRSIFQPIVELGTGAVVGIEAFSRGPDGSPLRLPRVMFSVGRDAGLARELDRVCREQAIATLPGLHAGETLPILFLNATAESLLDPGWRSAETLDALERAGFAPSRVVLETSERQLGAGLEAIRDSVDLLRQHGYRLSLDDIGSGARSEMLVETLRPEFIKFDMTLVRHVSRSQLARELIRSLVDLASRAGARLIAECVETADERRALQECGAAWGQGRLLGSEFAVRPTVPGAARGAGDSR